MSRISGWVDWCGTNQPIRLHLKKSLIIFYCGFIIDETFWELTVCLTGCIRRGAGGPPLAGAAVGGEWGGSGEYRPSSSLSKSISLVSSSVNVASPSLLSELSSDCKKKRKSMSLSCIFLLLFYIGIFENINSDTTIETITH